VYFTRASLAKINAANLRHYCLWATCRSPLGGTLQNTAAYSIKACLHTGQKRIICSPGRRRPRRRRRHWLPSAEKRTQIKECTSKIFSIMMLYDVIYVWRRPEADVALIWHSTVAKGGRCLKSYSLLSQLCALFCEKLTLWSDGGRWIIIFVKWSNNSVAKRSSTTRFSSFALWLLWKKSVVFRLFGFNGVFGLIG
jgi:hypothetical protein